MKAAHMGQCECCHYWTDVYEYDIWHPKKSAHYCEVCASTHLSNLSRVHDGNAVYLASSLGWLANAYLDMTGQRDKLQAIREQQRRREAGEENA